MATYCFRVKNYPFVTLLWILGLVGFSGCASPTAETESLGADTYTITKKATTGFSRDTATLKEEALAEAQKFCAERGKQLKVVSVTTHKPRFYTQSIANAKVVFKALDANDPELQAPVAESVAAPRPAAGTPTDDLYTELTKLDELRTRGILTDEEFQAEKKKVLSRSK